MNTISMINAYDQLYAIHKNVKTYGMDKQVLNFLHTQLDGTKLEVYLNNYAYTNEKIANEKFLIGLENVLDNVQEFFKKIIDWILDHIHYLLDFLKNFFSRTNADIEKNKQKLKEIPPISLDQLNASYKFCSIKEINDFKQKLDEYQSTLKSLQIFEITTMINSDDLTKRLGKLAKYHKDLLVFFKPNGDRIKNKISNTYASFGLSSSKDLLSSSYTSSIDTCNKSITSIEHLLENYNNYVETLKEELTKDPKTGSMSINTSKSRFKYNKNMPDIDNEANFTLLLKKHPDIINALKTFLQFFKNAIEGYSEALKHLLPDYKKENKNNSKQQNKKNS